LLYITVELTDQRVAIFGSRFRKLVDKGFDLLTAGISKGAGATVVGGIGLMWSIENPDVLERCIELLLELQQGIKANGFDKEQDELLLKSIYGDPGVVHLRQTLQDEYVTWFCTAEVTEEKRAQEGYATPEQCVRIVLRAVGAEIRRLEQYQQKRESIESERGKVEILRQCVPDSPGLDRLLRYASSLERAFDRVLTQFDRAQQIRREQSPAPGGSR
jgi:hypothetical protein